MTRRLASILFASLMLLGIAKASAERPIPWTPASGMQMSDGPDVSSPPECRQRCDNNLASCSRDCYETADGDPDVLDQCSCSCSNLFLDCYAHCAGRSPPPPEPCGAHG
jgi:hypothetical protein